MDYKVISVRNSIAYDPGAILSKEIVARLCDDPTWEVVIMPLEQRR